MAEELGKEYRPVNADFLDEAGNDFDVYYKTTSILSSKYVRFIGTNHKEKILEMLEKGMCENVFYVHESDLFKYYNQATKSLRSFVTDAGPCAGIASMRIDSICCAPMPAARTASGMR